MNGLRVIWSGEWDMPDEPDEPEQIDDGGLSTGDHVPPRDLASPVTSRDRDNRGPGRKHR